MGKVGTKAREVFNNGYYNTLVLVMWKSFVFLKLNNKIIYNGLDAITYTFDIASFCI